MVFPQSQLEVRTLLILSRRQNNCLSQNTVTTLANLAMEADDERGSDECSLGNAATAISLLLSKVLTRDSATPRAASTA